MAWFPAPGMKVVSYVRAAQLCALLVVVAASAGFGTGWQVRGWREAKVDLKDERTDRAAVAEENDRRRAISVEHEQRRGEIEQDFREADHDLDAFVAARPDLWGCDIGPDGLQLIAGWDEAGRGRASEPDAPVPDAAAEPAERPASAPAGEPERP